MKRKIALWLLTLFCLLALAGCGREKGDGRDEAAEEIAPTGKYAPLAEYAMLPIPDKAGTGTGDCVYIGDEVLYLEIEWVEAGKGEEYGHYESCLWAIAADGTGAPRVAAEGSGGAYICQFFVDKEGCLYLYEAKSGHGEGDCFYLRKVDADGQEVYRTDLSEAMDYSSSGDSIKGYVDEEGNVVLLKYFSPYGQVFFLDDDGRYLGMAEVSDELIAIHHNTNSVLHIGGKYYLWETEYDFGLGSRCFIVLREIDFLKRQLSDKIKYDVTSFASYDFALLDGGEMGLLASTRDVLWQYDLETGEALEFFRWDDESVNLDGRFVTQIIWGNAGEGGIPMEIFAYEDHFDTQYVNPMTVSIRYVDEAYIPKRQIVNIGIESNYGNIEKIVQRFNRFNPGYKAVLAEYSPSDLKELLMYGKEVPDLLDITGIGTEWLDAKELLEDLAPYFKKSENISKEDILPAVWRILERDGRITSMATSFTIRTLITTAEVREDGWSYDEFLRLEEEYPESRYFTRYDGMQVWGVVSSTGLDSFIDWKRMKSSFDSAEFKELLEKISSQDYPRRQWQNGTVDEELERLMTQQVLFQYANYGSPYDYDKKQDDSGGAVKSVGFPTADGEPRFLFSASQNLGIYAYSPNKDGAWAFLEFFLSENEQSWTSSEKDVFPVRTSAFEAYLARPRYSTVLSSLVPTLEGTPDKLRYMVEHLGMNRNAADEINAILLEELQAYFAGDKTVDEVAEIIQNRVQLYLDEI